MLYPPLIGRRRAGGGGPGSYVFNATDELLSAIQSGTSSDRTRCTFSFWVKQGAVEDDISNNFLISEHLETGTITTIYHDADPDFNDLNFLVGTGETTTVGYEFTGEDTVGEASAWEHFVARWNTNEATSDNRMRMYKNGILLSDSTGLTPGSSALHHFFDDEHIIEIGNALSKSAKKMAFIEVLDGVDAAPTEFAFNNGGTWTRKPYTGSYGTHGFRLDGTTDFADAANGRIFDGENMTAEDNIDREDLPPHI